MSVLRTAAGRARAPRLAGGRQNLVTVAVVLAVLVLWQVGVTVAGTSVTVLPGPLAIATQADWGTVLQAAGVTVLSTFLGFLVGNLVGLVLAVVITASRLLSDLVFPLAVFVRSIPIVALAPFLILAFGRGPAASTAVAALIVFFPTLINVILGLRSVPAEAIELTRVINASALFQYVHVRIPFALPAFVSALKISAPSAVLGVMTAEWIVGGAGLGRLVVQSWLTLEVPTMWAGVVLSAVVAWLLFSAVSLTERLLLGWAVRT
ncbi:ABC transporter permease [Microbacterium sp. SORGH_AS_0888]|uniref:ABC transporter permease n=1 Tax=Microbacterium sp. SORGH_AS_0888 TaxID=3041791 RepID=UPI0027825CD4|nr:ABC transporter permease subunit [Microbacterium sp. SORGH_AS_0888]MDQ1130481.1 NitT/TauT family transport system permease protein [Microbacterium sp. SORGH_AS_0888]